ncbi:putative reverse transcriptase domain-containing protein [Tanacetum coccineum]
MPNLQGNDSQGITASMAAHDQPGWHDSHTSELVPKACAKVARECTYPDFLKCQPMNFKGTEGVVGLTQWFEKIESVHSISNSTTPNPEAAHHARRTLTKIMTDKYCPRGEIKKLEFEMWNFKVKGTDVVTYSQTFQGLGTDDAIVCNDNKRKFDDTARNNQNQQPNKRQNTRRAYAAGNGDRKPYGGPKPLNPLNVNTRANQRVCFECGAQGHFKRDCPKLKNNNNRGNRVGNAKAQAKVYAVGNAGANPDNNVITGTFLLNNRYASILFDTGADRSFVSTAFSSRIVITPTALDHDYNVELADGRIVGLNTISGAVR